MDWNHYLPGLEPDPVVGDVGDYERASDEARRLQRTTDDVVGEFARVASSDGLAELRGATAEALADLVRDVDNSLAELPPLFGRLDRIFTDHANLLRDLDREVESALARARIRWGQRNEASVRLDGERGELSAISNQLWWLRSADPELHADRIDELERAHWSQARVVERASTTLSTAITDLERSRTDHQRLTETEAELVDATVRALGQIDLGDLSDPNGILDRLAAFAGAITGAIGGLAADVVDRAVDALGVLLDGLVTLAGAAFDAALTALAVGLGVILLSGALLAAAVAISAIAVLAVVFAPLVILVAAATAVGLIQLSTRSTDGEPDPRLGDAGGTYTSRATPDWDVAGHAETGRAVLTTALDHTNDGDRIRQDEFEIVTIVGADGSRQHVVVLPGVIDLSSPDLGWNQHHRSVRDTDRAAFPSSVSTGMDDNPYAIMVYQSMLLHGLEPGDKVMLVGHSYGADTALDLAADPRFNGPGAFDVTHVHAAAYHSGPQMPHVPAGTRVLATQNAADLVVQGENFGDDLVAGVDSYGDATRTLLSGDIGGLNDLGRFIGHADGATHPLRGQLETLVPGEYTTAPGQTRIVFAGGSERAGHDPAHYIEYLDTHASDAVADFEASVGAAGYGGPGVVHTLDVSVPDSGVPTLEPAGN